MKGLCVRGELETEQRLQHIDPHSSGYHSLSFLFSWFAQLGPSIFPPTDLDFLSPGLYNNLTSTYILQTSQFALNSTPRQSRSSPGIFDQMHLLFTPVHFLAGPGRCISWLGRRSICNSMYILPT